MDEISDEHWAQTKYENNCNNEENNQIELFAVL